MKWQVAITFPHPESCRQFLPLPSSSYFTKGKERKEKRTHVKEDLNGDFKNIGHNPMLMGSDEEIGEVMKTRAGARSERQQ